MNKVLFFALAKHQSLYFQRVLDETELPELIHEEIHARPRGADHFRESLLRDFRQRALRIGPAVAREQQQSPRQPFFARVEELIDEVRFDANVPAQHVGEEPIRERGLLMEQPRHCRFLDDQHAARHHRRGGADAKRLTGQGAFAEKIAGAVQCARSRAISRSMASW